MSPPSRRFPTANKNKDAKGRFAKKGLNLDWTPPDACPECGNQIIIPVYERKSIACPECRKEIPCK